MLNLGVMYATGRSVPQDDREAAAWYRKAAEQGDTDAMCMLGLMSYKGRGIPKDDVESYVWLSVAAAFGHEAAREYRELPDRQLTAEERVAAQERVRELLVQLRDQSKD